MSMSDKNWPTSPLAAATAAFDALTCAPAPLTLDLDTVDPALGLPRDPMPLSALRDWLLSHPTAYTARDTVWRELIVRARTSGPQWVIAAVGMAMPALLRYAAELSAGYAGDPDDIESEILTGFLAALRDHVNVTQDAPQASLCRAAWRAGRQLRIKQQEYLPVEDIDQVAAGPRTPKVPYGHPDVLVHRAVALGILDEADEQAYVDVRLGRRSVEPIATRMGITADALRMRLGRIDIRLARALADGLLTDVPSSQAAKTAVAHQRHRRSTRTGRPTRRLTPQAATAA
jgi:DNA-directed RNA polymerase specialized sigma24 family protein